eukprot:tig00021128_g18893.t1
MCPHSQQGAVSSFFAFGPKSATYFGYSLDSNAFYYGFAVFTVLVQIAEFLVKRLRLTTELAALDKTSAGFRSGTVLFDMAYVIPHVINMQAMMVDLFYVFAILLGVCIASTLKVTVLQVPTGRAGDLDHDHCGVPVATSGDKKFAMRLA